MLTLSHLTAPVRIEMVAMAMRTGAFSFQLMVPSVGCDLMARTKHPMHRPNSSTLPSSHQLHVCKRNHKVKQAGATAANCFNTASLLG